MHLVQIVDSFRPFPRKLLDKGDTELMKEMFTDDGAVAGYTPNYECQDLASEGRLEGLNKDKRAEFVSF